jgi:hypothetical protein
MIKNDNKNMHICCCGKSYKYQSGISRHKKKCPSIVVKPKCLEEVGNSNEVAFLKQKLLEKENENKELVNKICAMAPKIGSNNISINVFLNEHCKNAMSLADFTNQIQLTLTDIVKTKQLGFAGGVSNILIKNLNELKKINTKKIQTLTYFGFNTLVLKNIILNCHLKGIDRVVPIGQALDLDFVEHFIYLSTFQVYGAYSGKINEKDRKSVV